VSAPEGLDEARAAFADAVNMTAAELEDWLATDESRAAGQKPSGGGESTGHESGRRIVQVLRTKKADLTDDDVAHMRKVAGYVKRHTAQRPDRSAAELEHAAWTASLRNWGHDPLR
jgi:hypothetical protein